MSVVELLILPLVLAAFTALLAVLSGALVALYRHVHWSTLAVCQQALAKWSLNAAAADEAAPAEGTYSV